MYDAAVAHGARGIVVAGVGAGSESAPAMPASQKCSTNSNGPTICRLTSVAMLETWHRRVRSVVLWAGDDSFFAACDTDVEVAGQTKACVFHPVKVTAADGLAEIASGDWVSYRQSRHRT
jgi:hypothetical protein